MGEKRVLGRVWCFLRLNSGKNQSFRLAFHSMVTLRVSTTRRLIRWISNLELVALEQLLSIEGAVENRMVLAFLRGRL